MKDQIFTPKCTEVLTSSLAKALNAFCICEEVDATVNAELLVLVIERVFLDMAKESGKIGSKYKGNEPPPLEPEDAV